MKHKKQSGFTLIELITVVAIIGIVASMGVTNYQETIDRGRFDKTQQSIIDIATKARMKALEGSEGSVTFMGSLIGVQSYFIAAIGLDADGDGVLEWDDANSNGVPEDGEGELSKVVDFVVIDDLNVWMSGVSFLGQVAGCTLVIGGGGCSSLPGAAVAPFDGQATFRGDGFLYTTNSILSDGSPIVDAFANLIIIVSDGPPTVAESTRIVRIGANGSIVRRL